MHPALISFTMALLCVAPLVSAAVKTETAEHRHGDTTLKGYLAYDDALEGNRGKP